MKWTLIVLALSGCAGYQRNLDCIHSAGPDPTRAVEYLGVVGAVVASQDDGHQAWVARVDQCIKGDGVAAR